METPKCLTVLLILCFKRLSWSASANISGQELFKERDFKFAIDVDPLFFLYKVIPLNIKAPWINLLDLPQDSSET